MHFPNFTHMVHGSHSLTFLFINVLNTINTSTKDFIIPLIFTLEICKSLVRPAPNALQETFGIQTMPLVEFFNCEARQFVNIFSQSVGWISELNWCFVDYNWFDQLNTIWIQIKSLIVVNIETHDLFCIALYFDVSIKPYCMQTR